MTDSSDARRSAQAPPRPPITGVRNPARLRAVAEVDLPGRVGDPDLDAIVATLRLACASPMAVVNVVSPDLQTYAAEVGIGSACSSVADQLSFCAEVVDTGKMLSVSDAAAHPVYRRNPMVVDGQVGAYAGVPLIDGGVVLGTVSIFSAEARPFSAEVLEILHHQGQLAASVLALRRSARTDVLTGLPNRALFLDRLGTALARLERHPGMVSVMYLDVDNFKTINDTYGHAGGDEVLVELGARVRLALRQADTLGRFGGDEFVILCEDVASADDAELMADRIIAATNEPWIVRGRAVPVDISIGLALADSHTTDAVALLDHADAAMYAAKQLPGSGSQTSTRTAPPLAVVPDPTVRQPAG